jgi:histidinol-phosphate aminotransferase
MPPYVAGRPAARDAFKLSSNENPYPPLPGVLEAAVTAAASMNRYPDMGNAGLYAALAETYGVPVADLAVATGSTGLIYGLLSAFCEPGDEVVYAWRSFEAYPIAVLAAGAASVHVPLTKEGRHDLEAMAASVGERTKVVLLCSPNNPTGPALTQAEVDAFLDRIPDDVLVVLDEAYVEFVRIEDAVDGLATYRARRNVAVLRTFSKAYGLAGFRVGYCIAPAPVATALRAITLPFGVNLVAQAAAVASLHARGELLERVDALVEERSRVLAGVRAGGWEVPDPQGNFVWFPFPGEPERITAFVEAAEAHGIIVRPLGTDGVRVTIGEPEANDRLIRLAQTFER